MMMMRGRRMTRFFYLDLDLNKDEDEDEKKRGWRERGGR